MSLIVLTKEPLRYVDKQQAKYAWHSEQFYV